MVYGAGLENQWVNSPHRFESCTLRQTLINYTHLTQVYSRVRLGEKAD